MACFWRMRSQSVGLHLLLNPTALNAGRFLDANGCSVFPKWPQNKAWGAVWGRRWPIRLGAWRIDLLANLAKGEPESPREIEQSCQGWEVPIAPFQVSNHAARDIGDSRESGDRQPATLASLSDDMGEPLRNILTTRRLDLSIELARSFGSVSPRHGPFSIQVWPCGAGGRQGRPGDCGGSID